MIAHPKKVKKLTDESSNSVAASKHIHLFLSYSPTPEQFMNVSEVSPGLFLTAPATRDGFSSLLGVDEDRVPQYLILSYCSGITFTRTRKSQPAHPSREAK